MPDDIAALNVASFPLFKGIEETVIREFFASGFTFDYSAGTPLVEKESEGETFFLIIEGFAKLSLVNSQRQLIGMTLFKPGEFFGEVSVFEERATRSASVSALNNVRVLTVNKKEFSRMLHEYPDLAINIIRVMGSRLVAMNNRMTALILPEFQRVMNTIHELVRREIYHVDDDKKFLPSLPLDEWALLANTSSKGFLESIEKLRDAGVLDWRNKEIYIKDTGALDRILKQVL